MDEEVMCWKGGRPAHLDAVRSRVDLHFSRRLLSVRRKRASFLKSVTQQAHAHDDQDDEVAIMMMIEQ